MSAKPQAHSPLPILSPKKSASLTTVFSQRGPSLVTIYQLKVDLLFPLLLYIKTAPLLRRVLLQHNTQHNTQHTIHNGILSIRPSILRLQASHELTPIAKKVQTPQQRRANEAFAKKQEVKRGKPEPVLKKSVPQKSPINKFWLFALLFVVCGGLIFELLRIIAGYF
ncbi:hypothetical protein E4T38_07752 [Aureobasidium subglaciale]|nr:hypothetical protein E4T38_07752 [Aureobasidium subglaciale]KAI5216798.1 hypothetical protein E4T40_07762 [Aureobasidium subglaciale]KAI5220036.1 hypothetical protein E4T41_07677 [Aureobasidium subglaciale]KAI5257874.1 hypothetical protein E4T46_07653 [Aureobasidium subglaciale]